MLGAAGCENKNRSMQFRGSKVPIRFKQRNGYTIYVDIMTGEKLSSIIRLLICTSFIGQFIVLVGGEGLW